MRVYELMDRLSKFPAGAEIVVCSIMSEENMEKCERVHQLENDEQEIYYALRGVVDDLQGENKHCVRLYVDMGERA